MHPFKDRNPLTKANREKVGIQQRRQRTSTIPFQHDYFTKTMFGDGEVGENSLVS